MQDIMGVNGRGESQQAGVAKEEGTMRVVELCPLLPAAALRRPSRLSHARPPPLSCPCPDQNVAGN